jgi:hypothetical protein
MLQVHGVFADRLIGALTGTLMVQPFHSNGWLMASYHFASLVRYDTNQESPHLLALYFSSQCPHWLLTLIL